MSDKIKSIEEKVTEVLEKLEGDSRRKATEVKGRRGKKELVQQMSFFGQKSPLLEELGKLDINSLTPLEALTQLYELQNKAKQE